MSVPGGGGGTAKKKRPVKRKGGQRYVMPPDPVLSLTPTGPKPGVPKLRPVDVDLGVDDAAAGLRKHRRRTKAQLDAARKEGRHAVEGQLNAIEGNIGTKLANQQSKYNKNTRRIVGKMDALTERQRAFGIRQETKAQNQAEGVLRMRSAGGAKTTGADSAIYGSARRQAAAASRYGTKSSKALSEQGHTMRQAGKKSLNRMERVEETQAKNSMSIVEVLAAEQKREDVQFMQTMKHEDKMQVMQMRMQERSMEAQQAHDIQMSEMSFEQGQYMARLNQRLEQEYTQWQLDNDLMLTPEQQAATDWRYRKKEILLSGRLSRQDARNSGEGSTHNQFDQQMTATTDAVESTIEAFANPATRKWAQKQVAEGNYATVQQAFADKISSDVERTMPANTEMSAVNSAIETTLSRLKGGTEGLTVEGDRGAPGWEEIKGFIGGTSGQMQKYINGHDGQLKKYQQEYRALRVAQSPLNQNHPSQTDPKIEEDNENGFWDKIGNVWGDINDSGAVEAIGASAFVAGAVKAVTSAGAAASGISPNTLTYGAELAKGAQNLVTGARVVASGASGELAALTRAATSPGALGNAVKAGLSRFGMTNLFASGAEAVGVSTAAESALVAEGSGALNTTAATLSEGGFIGSGLLASAGLLAAAGLVSHKLIRDAATQYEFAEGAMDENLQSTIDLMDAVADDPEDLERIFQANINNGPTSNLWTEWSEHYSDSSGGLTANTGWTGDQEKILRDRYMALSSLNRKRANATQ